MGKSKTTKFKRPQFNSVGLSVNAVKEADGADEEHDEESCPAAELLEKVGPRSHRGFKVITMKRTDLRGVCYVNY